MIEAQGLTMDYGPVRALNKASFQIEKGQVVGLLGPNGAGKSTTMKILTTYLHPTAGTARVAGHDILDESLEVRQKVGYLPEVLPLYLDMEVRDYLRFVGRGRGLSGDTLRKRIEWCLEYCGLRPMFRKLLWQLSKGYRQRTALAQALIHDPEVVILDEPTSGLDPQQIIEIRRLIRMLAEEKTVILSTHILQEAEASSDWLIIISHGKIVGKGTVAELREGMKERARVRVKVEGPREDVESRLKEISIAQRVSFEGESGGVQAFCLESADAMQLLTETATLCRDQGWKVVELAERAASLEDIFLNLTQSERPEAGAGKDGVEAA